jgi:hypothetical protein
MDDMENERKKMDTTFMTSGITTSFLIYTKTSNQNVGVLRSRDGGGEVTSEPQSLRNRSNAG